MLSPLLKLNLELIIHKWDNHSITKWNQTRWTPLINLLMALHEHEGTIAWDSTLAFFANGPTFFLSVLDLAVISTDGFHVQTDFTLSWSSDGLTHLLAISKDVDLVLNVVCALLGADPARSCSEIRKVLSIDAVIFVKGSHDVEILCWLMSWNVVMGKLIKVIVNHFSNVDDGAFLDLTFRRKI